MKECQKNQLSFKKIESNSSFDITVCYCGALYCHQLPFVSLNDLVCQRFVFYQSSDDIYFLAWKAQYQNKLESEKSELLLPGRGNYNEQMQTFQGYCYVCSNEFADYKQHIQTPEHHSEIEANRFNLYIQQLCSNIGKIKHIVKKRKKGQFVNKRGLNRRYRFLNRNKSSGKFEY